MLVIPAVDVLDGKVVRLQRGQREQVQVYADDPAAAASGWAKAGARFLHVVNLNAAFGEPVNLTSLCARLAREVGVPFEVGGGIRSAEAAEAYLAAGAARIVVGTSTVRDSRTFLEILRRVGGERVVVAVDVKQGRVATHGWTATVDLRAEELAGLIRGLGVGRLMVTDVERDGMMAGPNVELMRAVAKASGLPVIASGGIASVDDLRRLKAEAPAGIEAAIVGKALYDGRIKLEEVRDL